MLVQIISWLLILSGIFFAVTSAVGLFRLPDFFARVHAAGIGDTVSAALIILGLMLNSGFTLISIKLFYILFLLWFTSPISSHSVVKAARHSGLEPFLVEKEKTNRKTD